MSTLDVYMDASSDVRYNQVVEKVKANKKKAIRKVKKKALQSNVVQMEPLVNLAETNQARPESRVASSDGAPRTQFRLRNYSTPSGDREDYNFDSVSLESASKTVPMDRKVHISSPPPSSDRKQGTRTNFTPYSPARILVQPSSQTGLNINKSAAHRSPPEVSALFHTEQLCTTKLIHVLYLQISNFAGFLARQPAHSCTSQV